MNSHDPLPEDPQLRSLLRGAHPAPSLPPRFQEGVWQRVERSQREAKMPSPFPRTTWLQQWFRPSYAAAVVAVAMLSGTWMGLRHAEARSRIAERARYVASVDPFQRPFP